VALEPGTRLGPYEILTPIGAGGMGEVFRATDSKLGRDVALKILPASFTNDPERIARFRREAQVLASLNHPHIAQIYGLEEGTGTQFLVLELVDGESLDKRIARGAIPVEEAFAISRQIVEALEAAHEKGIIHRDLKPANIALTRDDRVKVLDFGLAKAVDAAVSISDVSMSPTITSPAMMTGVGMILGTAAYMSPEQAKGRPADKRSDVWAFGAVFYEMLAGKRAFDGQDVGDTLAAVLRGDPDWRALPAETPDHIRLLLKRCLERDRAKRVGDIAVVRFMLAESFSLVEEKPDALAVRMPIWKRALLSVAAVIATAAILFTVARSLESRLPAAIVTRFAYELPSSQRFSNPGRRMVAISADGTRIAYVANLMLFLKSMSDLEGAPVRGLEASERGVTSPAFSPDGKSLAFWSAGAIKRIPTTGGTPVTLAEGFGNPFGVSWDDSGLLVADANRIVRVPSSGGSPEPLVVLDGETPGDPQMLPGGRSVLFSVVTNGRPWDEAAIVIYDLASKSRQTVIERGTAGQYVATGHVLYASSGVLFAVSFDVARGQAIGEPRSIVEGVARAPGGQTGTAQFAVSNNGSLVYIPGPSGGSSDGWDLATFDRHGHVEPLKLQRRMYESPRYSPDGNRIAVGISGDKQSDIWIYDLSGSKAIRQLTFGGRSRFPIWTPDGTRVTFQSDRQGDSGIFWQPADGARPAERLTTATKGTMQVPAGWFPKEDRLLIAVRAAENSYSLTTLDTSSRQLEPFSTDTFIDLPHTSISPDGRWVAYDEASQRTPPTVFIRPFPPTAKYRVETGLNPFWAPDGKTLYYVSAPGSSSLSAVKVTIAPSVEFDKLTDTMPRPQPLGGGPKMPRQYDASPDGEHFIIAMADDASSRGPVQGQIRIILNWFEELKTQMQAK